VRSDRIKAGRVVIPAQAGIHSRIKALLDARVRGHDKQLRQSDGAPAYADVRKVARAYVKASPERMVWGSDWPHPTEKADAKPDDAILFDLLANWAPDEATRARILVDNPAELYGFG